MDVKQDVKGGPAGGTKSPMRTRKLYRVKPGPHCGTVHALTGISLVEGEEHLLYPEEAGKKIFEEANRQSASRKGKESDD
jgi:hypothetical protein